MEGASESCDRWERGCAAIVVVAVVAELVLAAVHPSYDSLWNRAGSAFADAAIALGIVGEVWFGRRDARIQTELRNRSNKKLGDAEKIAAEANERAKQIELELAKFKAPRSLTPEQQKALAAEISVFKGQRVYLVASPSTSETEIFMRVLAYVFQLAEWTIVGTNSSPQPIFILPTGVIVQWYAPQGSDPMSSAEKGPSLALAAALNKFGIAASATGGPMHSMGAITVVINTKE